MIKFLFLIGAGFFLVSCTMLADPVLKKSLSILSDDQVHAKACDINGLWNLVEGSYPYVNEAKRRGLKCFAGFVRPGRDASTLNDLGIDYSNEGQHQKAIASYQAAIRVDQNFFQAHYNLALTYSKLGSNDKAIAEYKEALRINPGLTVARNKLDELGQNTTDERLAGEQNLFKENKQRRQAQIEKEPSSQPPEEQTFQSETGSGFFVSKIGHVITNAHVVDGCNRVMVGGNANKQVSAEIVSSDKSNDLALLKLSSLEMASAESKSLIQKLSIVVVPLASKGLLRSEDVRLGEKVLVAGYPFGDTLSNTIKVTAGIVSAVRGLSDDSGQFQLDAAVQPGNSGGPIYDSGGNIVGVVVSQLNKRAFGSLVENVNFGVKASTVRQFLVSNGLPLKKSQRIEEKSTEQLAEIAQNQALMVKCLQ